MLMATKLDVPAAINFEQKKKSTGASGDQRPTASGEWR